LLFVVFFFRDGDFAEFLWFLVIDFSGCSLMSAPSLVWSALLNPLAAIVAFDGGKKRSKALTNTFPNSPRKAGSITSKTW
jgi:hypothetical protein